MNTSNVQRLNKTQRLKTIVFQRLHLDGSASKLRTIDATRENILPAKGDSVVFEGRVFTVNKIELNYDEEKVNVYLI